MLDTGLKNTWTNLLSSDWVHWTLIDLMNPNQAKMMTLEKYEDFLELSVKQLITQSSPISFGQINMRCVKNQKLI